MLGAVIAAGFYKFIKILEVRPFRFEVLGITDHINSTRLPIPIKISMNVARRPSSDSTLRADTNEHGPSMDGLAAGRLDDVREEYGTGFNQSTLAPQGLSSRPRTDSPGMALLMIHITVSLLVCILMV
jgi:hypothetical protein